MNEIEKYLVRDVKQKCKYDFLKIKKQILIDG
jgi:hypothetical protein